MADNLTIHVGADATKLRADLALAQAELRKFSTDVRKEANVAAAAGGGATPGLIAAAAQQERAAAHAASLKASMAATNHEALTFSHRLRESAEHLESMHGRFRGGAEGFFGNIPLGGKGLAIGAGLAIGGELIKLGLEAAETSHHIKAFADDLGVSTGQVMAWRRAFRESGVDLDLAEKALDRLAVSAEKAADGQRKTLIETTKLMNTDVVARGRSTKPSAQLVDPSAMPEISGELLKFASDRREQMIQANTAGLRQDQVPSVMTLATSLRAQMAENTKAGRELRDEFTKGGGKVPALSRNEALDRLMPDFRDQFQKFHISLLESGGKLREFGEIAAQVSVALAHHRGPEGLQFRKTTMGRSGIDPLLGEAFAEQGELGGGAFLTPRTDNKDIEFGAESQKFINQQKAAIAAGKLQFGLAELGAVQAAAENFHRAAEAAKEFDGGLKTIEGERIPTEQYDAVVQKMQDITKFARDAAGALGAIWGGVAQGLADNGLGMPPAYASGGYIRGPGSGTSDSILARLSNGEYVMSAAAVGRLGLGTLNAMNFGRYLPRFAAGGMVGGGSIGGGGTPVHIHLGDKTYETSASPSVAAALAHEARSRLMLRTGAKPSWAGA